MQQSCGQRRNVYDDINVSVLSGFGHIKVEKKKLHTRVMRLALIVLLNCHIVRIATCFDVVLFPESIDYVDHAFQPRMCT